MGESWPGRFEIRVFCRGGCFDVVSDEIEFCNRATHGIWQMTFDIVSGPDVRPCWQARRTKRRNVFDVDDANSLGPDLFGLSKLAVHHYEALTLKNVLDTIIW